jgi:hypothetical protein
MPFSSSPAPKPASCKARQWSLMADTQSIRRPECSWTEEFRRGQSAHAPRCKVMTRQSHTIHPPLNGKVFSVIGMRAVLVTLYLDCVRSKELRERRVFVASRGAWCSDPRTLEFVMISLRETVQHRENRSSIETRKRTRHVSPIKSSTRSASLFQVRPDGQQSTESISVLPSLITAGSHVSKIAKTSQTSKQPKKAS